MPLTGDGPRARLDGTVMTLSAFEVLGVFPGARPTAHARGGRARRTARVVLLSHELWVSRYGADPSILGRTVNLNGTPREVIGVMPAGYDFPTPEIDLWTPLQLDPGERRTSAATISARSPGSRRASRSKRRSVDARSLVARFGEAGYGPNWFERDLRRRRSRAPASRRRSSATRASRC